VADGMSLNELLSVEDCHWIVPVFPLNVKTVLFVPVQTVVLPEAVPPTEAGLTVTVAVVLLAAAQPPLVTTAL
jgi:hypothetical protein